MARVVRMVNLLAMWDGLGKWLSAEAAPVRDAGFS
jgi:hypothetical protein